MTECSTKPNNSYSVPIKIGTELTINYRLTRDERFIPRKECGRDACYYKFYGTLKTETKKVYVVGIRSISEGYAYDVDGLRVYDPVAFLKALLVTEGLHRKPFYILPEKYII